MVATDSLSWETKWQCPGRAFLLPASPTPQPWELGCQEPACRVTQEHSPLQVLLLLVLLLFLLYVASHSLDDCLPAIVID